MSPHKLKFFIYETTQLTDFFFSLPSAVFFGAGAGLLGLFFASSWKGQVTLDVRRLTDWTQVQTLNHRYNLILNKNVQIKWKGITVGTK